MRRVVPGGRTTVTWTATATPTTAAAVASAAGRRDDDGGRARERPRGDVADEHGRRDEHDEPEQPERRHVPADELPQAAQIGPPDAVEGVVRPRRRRRQQVEGLV